MTIISIFNSIPWGAIGTAGVMVFTFLLLVQVAPIKLDPFGKFFRMVGRNINQGMMDSQTEILKGIEERLASLEERVDEGFEETQRVDAKLDYRMACTRRTHILRFSDEIMHGTKHSEEMFNQILDDIQLYDAYCATHPEFLNNRTETASKRIRSVYEKCVKENSFL